MRARRLILALATAVLASCGGGGGGDAPPPVALADFALFDDNPASVTAGTLVSPRDFLGAASSWYFTRST